MMAISHPFTSCINWNELGTLMDRVCSFSCVKDVYLFSIKVSNMAGIKYQLRIDVFLNMNYTYEEKLKQFLNV